MTSYVPLFLNTDSSAALVVGGGEIAAAKIEALASAGAQLEVVGRALSDGVLALCRKHGYTCHETAYDPAFLEGRRLVVAATDEEEVNQQVAADAKARSVLVNVVDNPPLCDVIFPALIRRGPLQIAISSSGIAPVLARMVKQTIEAAIPASFERLITFLQHTKQQTRAHLRHLQPRRLFYEQIIRGPVGEDILEGNHHRAEVAFSHALAQAEDQQQAALYMIGAGPGHPELVTLKAIRLLSQADVIMYDRLIPPTLLEQYARKDAVKISVGKRRDHHHKSQEDIDALIDAHLRSGHIVARVKGGDPGVYAHGAEEIEIARRLDVPYHIVPGVTAASGCAAYAGIPMTERNGAQAVRFLTVYKKHLHDLAFWHGLSYAHQETLCFYMSSHHASLVCEQLMEQSGFAPETPFLAIEQGTTPYQREYAGTLGRFGEEYGEHRFASPCLFIVGSVVNWHAAHRWREEPLEAGTYFPPLDNAAIAGEARHV